MSTSSENHQSPELPRAATTGEPPPVAVSLATPDGRLPDGGDALMSRAEAAKAFEVSVTTFRRRYEGRVLTPIVRADGSHFFRQEAVQELVIQRRSAASPGAYDGETAAAVFRLFEEGAHPVDVVLRLKLHPHAVVAMHKEWVSLRGGYVITAEVARQIASLPWMWGSFPIEDGERLLANLRTSAPHGRCTTCADAVAEVCPECAKRMAAAEAEQRGSDARRHREEQEEARRTAEWERDFAAMRRRRQKET